MTALLLAAGTGSRMGPAGKLTLPFGTSTVVGETARALVRAGVFARVVAVTGHRAADVETALREAVGDAVDVVHNAAFADGMSGSIAAGARALPEGEPVAVMLGDLPLVRAETLRRLAAALGGPADVVRPAYRGRPGHPVVFGAEHVPALRALAPGGDGARSLARSARRIDSDDPGVVTDLDTPAAYDTARRVQSPTT